MTLHRTLTPEEKTKQAVLIIEDHAIQTLQITKQILAWLEEMDQSKLLDD